MCYFEHIYGDKKETGLFNNAPIISGVMTHPGSSHISHP